MWRSHEFYRPYVPVARRRAEAARQMSKLRKKGRKIEPIEAFRGNRIAKSFWGQAWCRHLESYGDYENRLPRGRTYVRNGSVCHLSVSSGRVEAFVYGSELYKTAIRVDPLPPRKWAALKRQCSGKIGTLLELLQGKLSDEVMAVVTDPSDGLFPSPKEIRLDCSCPDYADLCKHLAAVLYGVGVRLDDQPELLFLLRGVDHSELVAADLDQTLASAPDASSSRRRLDAASIADVFGVEIEGAAAADAPRPPAKEKAPLSPPAAPKPPRKRAKKPAAPKPRKSSSPGAAKLPLATGADIQRLRRKFGMTQWEFGFIVGVTAASVGKWEAKGPAPLRANARNRRRLDAVAALSKAGAWERLDELL